MRFALREIRTRVGMTVDELSAKSGVSTDQITALENNTTEVCNSRVLSRLAEVLSVDIGELFSESKF